MNEVFEELKRTQKDELKYYLQETTPDAVMDTESLAFCANIHDSHPSKPVTRSRIREIINAGEMAIGSNNRGYFRITDEDTLNDQIIRLRKQIEAIQTRIDKTVVAYYMERSKDVLDVVDTLQDKCRMLVGLIAADKRIPYQTVFTLAYHRLENLTGFSVTKTPPGWMQSILDYVECCGLMDLMYDILLKMQDNL